MRRFLFVTALIGYAFSASAQVELVDPDAKPARPQKKVVPVPSADDDDLTNTNDTPEPPEPDPSELAPIKTPKKELPLAGKGGFADAGVKGAADAGVAAAAPVVPAGPQLPPIRVVRLTDSIVDAAFQVWMKANAANDVKAEQVARADLLKMKAESGAFDAEQWAIGMLRASQAHQAQGDSGAAVEQALTASELAPDLPAVWSGLASAYFDADPSGIGRIFTALGRAISTALKDPRYGRAFMANIGAVLLISYVLTTIAVVLALFIKRASFFVFDFHFLFPRIASRWQTGSLAVLLALMPVVFRAGIAVTLALWLALVSMYLVRRERIVAVVLIALLGFIAPLARWLVESTAFGDTPAEKLLRVDQGGPGAESAVTELERVANEGTADFPQLLALANLELRRGKTESAIVHLKAALAGRAEEPRAQTLLANALLITGDIENPLPLYKLAANKDITLAAPLYNLGRLYERRVAALGDVAAGEVSSIVASYAGAQERDPSYDRPQPPGPEGIAANVMLKSVRLTADEIVAEAKATEAGPRVLSQVNHILVGDLSEDLAMFLPLLLALLAFAFGQLANVVKASKSCTKCGTQVSVRIDPELSAGSQMCSQCISVFTKKSSLVPALKARKQLEIQRWESRRKAISTVLTLLCAGLGHLFSGATIVGALLTFCFVTPLVGLLFRDGLVRPEYNALPSLAVLVPLALVALITYLLALRGVRKGEQS